MLIIQKLHLSVFPRDHNTKGLAISVGICGRPFKEDIQLERIPKETHFDTDLIQT